MRATWPQSKTARKQNYSNQADAKPSDYFIALTAGDAPATLAEAQAAGIPALAYGKFINAILQFTIVAFALFLVIRQMNRLKARIAKGEAAPPAAPPRQEVLLEEIRDALRAKS